MEKTLKVSAKKAFKIKGKKSRGKIVYKKTSGKAKIKVTKNGTVIVKKGLAKGRYKVRVKAKQKATARYKGKIIKNIKVIVRVR